jgi:hypothetical protein
MSEEKIQEQIIRKLVNKLKGNENKDSVNLFCSFKNYTFFVILNKKCDNFHLFLLASKDEISGNITPEVLRNSFTTIGKAESPFLHSFFNIENFIDKYIYQQYI